MKSYGVGKVGGNYLYVIAGILALAGSLLFLLDSRDERKNLEESFLLSARAYFQSIVLMRSWNASYGGVYVEKRPGVESNQHLPNTDLLTTEGKHYALRNPALMTREISALAEKSDAFRFHITSLKLRNPENAPDPWERRALLGFEQNGRAEIFEYANEETGRTLFRYMAPLRVDGSCLKCHADMGYKIGDIRGGISVSFDITPLLKKANAREAQNAWIVALTILVVWLLTWRLALRHERHITEISRRFEDLLQSTEGIVWEADAASLNFSFVSQQAERILGYSVAEWLQPGFWLQHLHPDDRESVQLFCTRATAQDEPHDLEYRLIAQNGRVIWVHDTISVYQTAGKPRILRGLMIDITERNEAVLKEQALLREKNVILENALVGIVYLRDRVIVSCNRRFEEMFGYAHGELIGKNTSQLYATTTLYEEVGARAYKEIAKNSSYNEELELKHKDGSLFWGAITGQALDPELPQSGSIWIYADITERKMAEIEAEKLLRAVEQSPVSIVITNRQAEIEYVNPRFTQVTGYTYRDVLGKNPRLLQSGETPPETYREMWLTLLAGNEWRGILRNRRKSGELFWEEASLSPILDEHGEITHFIAVKEDITQRKAYEDALTKNEERLALALAATNDGLWDWNLATGEMYFSPRWKSMLGYATNEIQPSVEELASMIHPDDREEARTAWLAHLHETTPHFQSEFRMQTKHGTWLWVLNRGKVTQRDAVTGRALRASGTMTDVSETHELQEQRRFFEILAEQAPVPVYAIKITDGYPVAYANQATADHFGHPLELVRKQHLRDWDPDFAKNRMEDLVRQLKTGNTATFETNQHMADGSVVPAEVFARYIEFGGQGFVTGFFRDISERLARMKEIEENQSLLEQIVSRRTEQLTEALDAARVAEKAKDEFLANMSHEMRTPLNAILGLTHLALQSQDEERRIKLLTQVSTAGEGLLNTLNDLLDLSKIAAGHLELDELAFSIREEVMNIISIIGHKASEKSLRLVSSISDDVPTYVKGDPLRFRQIILNLLSNAIKFTKLGQVSLTISKGPEIAGMIEIGIDVSDTGIGMSAQAIERIFNPFTQADSTITRKYGGTGLGLTICKRLCEMMHGSIRVRSRPGEGSTFSATVRFAVADMPGQATRLPPNSLPESFHDTQVLVIEDQPINQIVACELMSLVGIHCDVANDGVEGLEKLFLYGPNHYDAVLLDVQMPYLDGLTTVCILRKEAGFSELPVIAVTAHIMAHEMEEAKQAGMSDHLGKPFHPDELYRALSRWVSLDKQTFAPADPISVPSPGLAIDLPGIDVADALARFGGDTEKYLHWLKNFLDGWREFEASLTACLDRGDLKSAHPPLHAFKGKSGALGMTELMAAAARLDDRVRSNSSWEEEWNNFKRVLHATCLELEGKLTVLSRNNKTTKGETHE